MDKKIMKLLGVCLFAVASVGVLTACSDNDAENPEGGKPGGEDVNPAPEVVEFVNSNLVYWGDKDGVGTDHFVLTLYTDMEVDATGNPIGPGKIMAFDDPENPTIMEDFIRALGAEPVIYPYRNECCGGYISLKEKDMSQNMCQKIEDSAKGFGADMLITACPLCKYNLNKNASSELPVYYFTELLAEALGVKEEVAK